MKNSALLFNIQHFCLDDGPGIRTTVFFKGCSLRCRWCHNPESISKNPEILQEKIGETLCGTRYTVQEVLDEILGDQMFYRRSSGGVTFSGGEPMLQDAFLLRLAQACKENGVSTALDTAGNVLPGSYHEALLHAMDLILYDIKAIDDALHRRCTGASNAWIQENLRRISANGNRIWIRIPYIPGWNVTPSEIDRMSALFLALKGIERIELLPYHPLGESKYQALGLHQETSFCVPTAEACESVRQQFLKNGVSIAVNAVKMKSVCL